MPRSAPKPCREAGCPALCTGEEREFKSYCVTHGPPRRRSAATHAKRMAIKRGSHKRRRATMDDAEKALQSFYATSAWRKKRDAYIKANPLCVMCESRGVTKGADVVDHIVERRDGGENLNSANLQSLCHRCHAVKTRDEKRIRPQRPL